MFFSPQRHKNNPLEKWRKAAGYTPTEASREVQLPPAILEEYESCNIAKIPMSCLAKFIHAYRVPPKDLINELPCLEELFTTLR